MDKKDNWNLRVYLSVSGEFDRVVKDQYRGDKGTTATAACLMFLRSPKEVRQAFIDVIKLAEGRGVDGTILDAAQKINVVWHPIPAAPDEGGKADGGLGAATKKGLGGNPPKREAG